MAPTLTKTTQVNPAEFLNAVEPERRRGEGLQLLDLFGEVTGYAPRMWGPSIVGFGAYSYTYASGHSGRSLATGFSPRKAKLSIYIMPGYQDFGPILERLGPHTMGKACLYITRLDKVDLDVLKELIQAGLTRLGELYQVAPE